MAVYGGNGRGTRFDTETQFVFDEMRDSGSGELPNKLKGAISAFIRNEKAINNYPYYEKYVVFGLDSKENSLIGFIVGSGSVDQGVPLPGYDHDPTFTSWSLGNSGFVGVETDGAN